ncbi:histidine kinase [Salinibacterium sp. G-O1]|uniref:sensor histidine kinase n=1 Tax=Salinibacterium sp. G-O1 TaxID=3046208 RepID=UPI0024B98906|nr:ATP-binding protein [Salinibacterium sp. G-O1]MDJ0335385.1 histidine kinase [Salinibacterium sp. G-O1]
MAVVRTTKFFPQVFDSVLDSPVRFSLSGFARPRSPRHAHTQPSTAAHERIATRSRALIARLAGWRSVIASWALGLAATILMLWAPFGAISYYNPSLHPAMGSVQGCIALAAAGVIHGRFMRRRVLRDFWFAQGLILIAAGKFVMVAEQPVAALPVESFDVWFGVSLRVVGIITIAAAVVLGRRLATRALPWYLVGGLPVAVMVGVGSLVLLVGPQLPAVPNGVTGADASQPTAALGILVTAHIVGAVGLAAASVALAVQAARHGNELLRWLAPACALGAFAQVTYAIVPTVYSDWFHVGNILGLGSSLLLLVGAVGEFRRASTSHIEAALHNDRLRLAREIHDGVIQELSYIRMEGQSIHGDQECRKHIVGACDRALDEARSAVQTLGCTSEESLSSNLHRALAELAQRYHFQLVVDLDDSIVVDSEKQHALTRITREAVSNAIHHGNATRVQVTLSQSDGQRELTIADDGTGFDVQSASAAGLGYGLVSMRERGRALPGAVRITSEAGVGSRVAVQW